MRIEILPKFRKLDGLPEQLSAAIVKYDWALNHVLRLNDILRTFSSQNNWDPLQTPDLPIGMVRIKIHEQPPKEIGLVIGDIVHSLRSSLDYATCSLLKIADAECDISKVQFPFGRPWMPLNSKEKSHVKGMHKTAFAYIEAARAGGHPHLDILNRISNQDKHRLILPVMLRRMPMKIEINSEQNTADFVVDIEKEHEWTRPLADGDIIEMGNYLALMPGFMIDGDPWPYPLNVINRLFDKTYMALGNMISAAKSIAG